MAKDAVGREIKVGDIVSLHGRVASVSGNTVVVACSHASTADKEKHDKDVAAWHERRKEVSVTMDPEKMKKFYEADPCPQLQPLKSTVSLPDGRHLEVIPDRERA